MTPAAQLLKLEVSREKRERLERALLHQVRAVKLPEPERNYVMFNWKGWKYDMAWPAQKVAIEVQGILYAEGKRGGHQTPSGIERDTSKSNEATAAGWKVLQVTAKQIADGRAIAWIERLLK